MTPAEYVRKSKILTKRPDTPEEYLQEAAYALFACRYTNELIWKKKIPAWMSRLDRTVVFELTSDLVMRVRDPKTGWVLAESEPGWIAGGVRSGRKND